MSTKVSLLPRSSVVLILILIVGIEYYYVDFFIYFLCIFQVSRLKGQVTRYKNQVRELEEREDELMKEKRLQAKEVHLSVWFSKWAKIFMALWLLFQEKNCVFRSFGELFIW